MAQINKNQNSAPPLNSDSSAPHIADSALIPLVNNLPDTMLYQVVITQDGARRFTYVSDNVIRLHEVTPEAVLADARTLYDQITPQTISLLAAQEERCLKSLETFRCEVCFTLPSGRVRWFRLTSTPTPMADGSVIWDGLETDITEQREMESMNRLFKLITNSSSDIIAAVDREYQYIVANDAYLKKHHKTAKEVVGHPFAEIIGDEVFQKLKPHLDSCLNGQPVQFEIPMIYPGNSTRHMEASYYPLRNDTSEIIGVVGVARDIAERKEIVNERLEMQSILRHSQKMEAVGQLAGGIAHDLNNLLTPIMGFSEFLTETLDASERSYKYSKHISNASQKAKDLVHKLLAFSRKQTLEFVDVDINQMIDEFRPFIERTIRENVNIVIQQTPNIPLTFADKGQLEQVLMNLIVNAQDAMPNGGDLTISTAVTEIDDNSPIREQLSTTGAYVNITVRDSGVGISEDIRERIFDPFFTTKGNKGTGLGLATAWGIIRQHDGGILVNSEPQKGSTISVYLPIRHEPTRAAVSAESNDVSPIIDSSGDAYGTILLVEDDPIVREVVAEQLNVGGYHVLVADSPQQALGILNEHNDIELLLTDVIMPQMNGKELYVAAQKVSPQLKVLYMSGYPSNVISSSGVLENGIFFIQKPFNTVTLLNKVQSVWESLKK